MEATSCTSVQPRIRQDGGAVIGQSAVDPEGQNGEFKVRKRPSAVTPRLVGDSQLVTVIP